VAKSSKTGVWYVYVEYGRTESGSKANQFQFFECLSESSACSEFRKRCEEKNTKRGVWETVGSKSRLVPKAKKGGVTQDLYVVRVLVSRNVGLPAARSICNENAVPDAVIAASNVKKPGREIDEPTRTLFRDLLQGAVKYTRSNLVGNTLPALGAIEDARELLQDALGRLKHVGSNVEDQVADEELRKLTYSLYGMVPRTKRRGAPEKDWILSQDNIKRWQDDLDAFETALKSMTISSDSSVEDVMRDIPAEVAHIPLNSELGRFLVDWWQKCTRNKHGHGQLKIHNLWSIKRTQDDAEFQNTMELTTAEMPENWKGERPMFYDLQRSRPDLTSSQRKEYLQSNVFLGFHGTRSVNVPGIIRESIRLPNQLVGVAITGAMFGPGSYFADDWGKSANYCSTQAGRSLYAGSSGHVSGRKSFMFACDVVLGNPHVAKAPGGFTQPPKGYHSVFGKAGHTGTFASSKLLNNEWIIYNRGRQCLRYLAELAW
jgi:hypothetical protein